MSGTNNIDITGINYLTCTQYNPFLKPLNKALANIVGPEQRQSYAASGQGLHCLHKTVPLFEQNPMPFTPTSLPIFITKTPIQIY